MEHRHDSGEDPGMKSRSNIVFTVFLIMAAALLVAEHRAHLAQWLPYWPYLLLLACPLLHVFMHRGHGHRDHGAGGKSKDGAQETRK